MRLERPGCAAGSSLEIGFVRQCWPCGRGRGAPAGVTRRPESLSWRDLPRIAGHPCSARIFFVAPWAVPKKVSRARPFHVRGWPRRGHACFVPRAALAARTRSPGAPSLSPPPPGRISEWRYAASQSGGEGVAKKADIARRKLRTVCAALIEMQTGGVGLVAGRQAGKWKRTRHGFSGCFVWNGLLRHGSPTAAASETPPAQPDPDGYMELTAARVLGLASSRTAKDGAGSVFEAHNLGYDSATTGNLLSDSVRDKRPDGTDVWRTWSYGYDS